MSAMQRSKGASGEREMGALLHELTGRHVRRRVRNHAGDDDLEGLPGWSVEVKRYRSADPADVARWWRQAVDQAERSRAWPVLLYRLDRQCWRAVWPSSVQLDLSTVSGDFSDALVSDPATWWRCCRFAAQRNTSEVAA